LPACRQGNDSGSIVGHQITRHSLSEVTETEVTYRGVEQGDHVFDLVGDTKAGTFAIPLEALRPEPPIGKTYWLSSVYWFFVLRESKSGPIVLSSGAISTVDNNVESWLGGGAVERISDWWHVPLAFEPSCDYETRHNPSSNGSDPVPLHRARVGENPGTRIASGTRGSVTIGGAAYNLWLADVDAQLGFTLTPAP
jgi:hypothetical protein